MDTAWPPSMMIGDINALRPRFATACPLPRLSVPQLRTLDSRWSQ